ncbi:SMP-30/gluconolactonase/LRE family protein [Roseateles koreensis]|uniref:SMP-30/gluconolactonase/LRE family protein n=1 Tax=Roseateles koreensis TaxID=2987526 RepID=A0ABT5KUH7_9BURK|nr:SMP-30/gluconolactonase/LRE family protein [Roseateles koreensis]
MTPGPTPALVRVPADAQLGECLLWCEREQALFWTDIDAGLLTRWRAADGTVQCWSLPDKLGSFALCEAPGLLLLGLSRGLALFDLNSGTLGPMSPVPWPADAPEGLRINDGRCDPQGRFVFGMFNPQGRPAGGFYRVNAALDIEHLPLPPATVANCIQFSPDGLTMYFTDSPTRQIWAMDYAPDGRLGAPRRFAALAADDGEPDGAAMDAAGHLWVALWGASCVIRLDPQGRETLRLPVPASQVTCPSFGGAARNRLFVTSARKQLRPAELAVQAAAGAVFELPGASLLGVHGHAEHRFISTPIS